MRSTHLGRVQSQLLGNLVEVYFQCVTRLRRAVPSLWPARRFIRKSAQALKLVARHIICDCLQGACVERTGYAIAAVSSTIQERLEVHSGYRAVFLNARFDVH